MPKPICYVGWLGLTTIAICFCGCLLQLNPDTKLVPSSFIQSCDLGGIVAATTSDKDSPIVWHEREVDGPTTTTGHGIGLVNASRSFKGCFSTVKGGQRIPFDPDQGDRLMRAMHTRFEDGLRSSGMHVTSVMNLAPAPGNPNNGRLVEFEISFDHTDKGQNVQHIGQIKARLAASKVREGAQELTVTITEDARPIVY